MPSLKSIRTILAIFLILTGIKLAYDWREISLLENKNSYETLESALISQDWEEADRQTSHIILHEAKGKKSMLTPLTNISLLEVENFPCDELLKIDELWLRYSNSHFGFSIQKTIWDVPEENDRALIENKTRFDREVGWSSQKASTFNFSLSAPKGHLPSYQWIIKTSVKIDGLYLYKFNAFLKRIKQCSSM
ncbi:GUN4 domain-containing protein [cf. Phormidesmis sp. LEGE 11477]|uniref:GUN4 domain-containing protein n=1 Tax=cf. Phormidesmis sp. LEGE 11477 TaxID=1828680 RepID=UPI001881A886|nr:GUN4 domain-containing protein [cf. Phormidesmis sp. LEGE 11477]MBE9064592.1 GUN4 domain-containing protein [cf. Phormidesmis sp. LEGE 11477]